MIIKSSEIVVSSVFNGESEFLSPVQSTETLIAKVPGGTVEDLFVHQNQIDQLKAVKGSLVLITLEQGKYKYTLLTENDYTWLSIPQGIPHAAVNFLGECTLVNAALRLRPAVDADYEPIKPSMPYELNYCRILQTSDSFAQA